MARDTFKPLNLIRAMTGIIKDDKTYLFDTMALVNLLVRGMIKEADWDFVKHTAERSLGIELVQHGYLCPLCLKDYTSFKGAIFCCATRKEIEDAMKQEDKDIF